MFLFFTFCQFLVRFYFRTLLVKQTVCVLQVTLLGTPAEEGLGGKIDLIGYGAFDDVDVAMMAHPFPTNDPSPIMLARER